MAACAAGNSVRFAGATPSSSAPPFPEKALPAAIASGPIILKNHQIHRQQTPITPAPMSLSRRSISPSEKPLRAVAKPASRFRPNRNSVRASLKSPAKGSAFCAIQNAILSRRHRISLSPRKLCAASLCATACGSTAKSDAAAVVRN